VSPKRRDRVAPPPRPDEWDVRFGQTDAAKGWEELCRQAPGNTRDAFELMRSGPRPPQDSRHQRLRGALAARALGGRELEQWQIEVTSAGRVWYLVDDDTRTVWVMHAGPGHPKAME
jgi:hypothetical protein